MSDTERDSLTHISNGYLGTKCQTHNPDTDTVVDPADIHSVDCLKCLRNYCVALGNENNGLDNQVRRMKREAESFARSWGGR